MKDRKHNKICSRFYICIAVDRSLVSYNVSRETLVSIYTGSLLPQLPRISLQIYISAMKRYGMRQPLQEFEKFLEMFWLCYAWKITLFERQRVCDFLRMYLTDRLSHRTTERRSRCHMPYLVPLREIKICNLK